MLAQFQKLKLFSILSRDVAYACELIIIYDQSIDIMHCADYPYKRSQDTDACYAYCEARFGLCLVGGGAFEGPQKAPGK